MMHPIERKRARKRLARLREAPAIGPDDLAFVLDLAGKYLDALPRLALQGLLAKAGLKP